MESQAFNPSRSPCPSQRELNCHRRGENRSTIYSSGRHSCLSHCRQEGINTGLSDSALFDLPKRKSSSSNGKLAKPGELAFEPSKRCSVIHALIVHVDLEPRDLSGDLPMLKANVPEFHFREAPPRKL